MINRYRAGLGTFVAASLATAGLAFAAPEEGLETQTEQGPMTTYSADASDQQSMQPALRVTDQVVRHQQVLFMEIRLPRDGWVVMHPSNGQGGMDHSRTIGQRHFSAGSHDNMIVELNEPVDTGSRIYAMLHEDTGVAGEYEYHESPDDDDLPMKVDGQPVMTSFKVMPPNQAEGSKDSTSGSADPGNTTSP